MIFTRTKHTNGLTDLARRLGTLSVKTMRHFTQSIYCVTVLAGSPLFEQQDQNLSLRLFVIVLIK